LQPRSPSPTRYGSSSRPVFEFDRPIKQESDRIYSRLDSGFSTNVSPLQGAKIVVANLQPTVTQEDITELFGDVGALKRARIVESGVAEVVFVKKSDAVRAVEIYHNRQLDGKSMKCHVASGR
jgi:RNA recognition motif-containing protein